MSKPGVNFGAEQKNRWNIKGIVNKQYFAKYLGKTRFDIDFCVSRNECMIVLFSDYKLFLIVLHRNPGQHNKFKSNVSLTELTEVILIKFETNSVHIPSNINPIGLSAFLSTFVSLFNKKHR